MLFRSALIPIAAGAMFPGFGSSIFGGMEGIGAGLLAGAATAALTGGNPLLGGITGALGGYSGAGLGSSIAKLGATPGGMTSTGVTNALQTGTGAPLVGASTQFISPFTPQGIAGGAGLGLGTVGSGATGALTNQAVNAGLTGINTATNLAGATAVSPNVINPSYLDNLKTGASKLISSNVPYVDPTTGQTVTGRSEEHTSELQSH